MNALVFLGIAVGVSMLGCGVLWLRSRQPGSMDAHIRDFARELDALAPGMPADRPRGRPAPREERDTGPERRTPPLPPAARARPPQPGSGPRPLPPKPGGPRSPQQGGRPGRPTEPGTGPRSG